MPYPKYYHDGLPNSALSSCCDVEEFDVLYRLLSGRYALFFTLSMRYMLFQRSFLSNSGGLLASPVLLAILSLNCHGCVLLYILWELFPSPTFFHYLSLLLSIPMASGHMPKSAGESGHTLEVGNKVYAKVTLLSVHYCFLSPCPPLAA